MKKNAILILTILSVFLYFLTIRGNFGKPTPRDIEFNLSKPGQSFETSQERSRYAIILSLINNKSFNIDNYASMGTPDIGKINGHYYSFFPPLTSILAIPFYLVGDFLNATQLFTFLVSTVFAYLTMLIMYLYTRKLGLHFTVGIFTALSFGFATNAWGYSVTLYAHLISSFLIMLALYISSFRPYKLEFLNQFSIWILYGIAVFIDFPNLFLFLPIAVYNFSKSFNFEKRRKNAEFTINWGILFTPLIFIILMLGYAIYNKYHFGNYTTLSNAIPRVKDLKEVVLSIPESEKTAVSALNTRNLLNGINSFIISTDRGIIFFTPIVLLFTLSLKYLNSFKNKYLILLLSVPSVCITLYSMFGDPYGGWAFGSRYLIASIPPLLILNGIALQRLWEKKVIKVIFTLFFIYSAAVSLLAPLTTNVIPPFVEAEKLGIKSDYSINFDMLKTNTLNSFFYNAFLKNSVTGMAYYIFILLIVVAIGVVLIWLPKKIHENKN